ncbi:MAG: D-2-hydroxyacid dehydrogenase [bacterium]|nr:D-2-hydroxyacid dehydrogenase [bacterium]
MAGHQVLIGMHCTPDVEAILNDAPEEVEVTLLPEGESLGDHLSGVEILFGRLPESDFDRAEALKWVQQPSAGVEGTMYPAFQASDMVLTNCRNLYNRQISEHAFALLLALTRRIPNQLEFKTRKHWQRVPCVELAGLTMGIIGLGGIGRGVAERAKAFEMEVLAVDAEDLEKPAYVDQLGKLDFLPEMMSQSHVVVVCCPSTPETHKMLSHDLFNRLPSHSYEGEFSGDLTLSGSFLVNVSRGKVVDEEALIAALRSGKLAGAGLDVTYTEPCPEDSPLWTEPNVILTSHSAGSSQHVRVRAMELFVENLHRYVKGEPLVNVVDKEKGY